jgi:exoribonuclease-2
MLPKSLSEDACSLILGQKRPAMSFLILLSPAGEILESDIVSSIVQVKRQLTYQEAERLLESDEDLRDLARLSRNLQGLRVAAGALLLPIPDVNITIDEQSRISVSVDDADTPTRTLVAEFMVLANMVGASFVADREVPGLYRCQEPPHQRFVTAPQKDLFLNFRQRKQLRPGELLTKPQPHSGVGTSAYTTVTSPIRRFLDLVMQHQITSLIRGQGARFSRLDLQGFAGDIQTAQTRLNLVRRLRHRYWLLCYLERHVGERVDALLLEKGPRKVTVILLDCHLDPELPPSQAIDEKPGAIIQVSIDRVQPLDNILRLAW